MTLQITSESHLDHNLSPAHVAWLQELFADMDAFFIATATIPDHLGEVECGLYGPSMGDAAVVEEDVTYAIRGKRKCASRVVARPVRMTRTLTIVAGPSGDKPCVLYTSYGGPQAPREPGDTSISNWEDVTASRAFWAVHALVG
jgi:hypothetical protein